MIEAHQKPFDSTILYREAGGEPWVTEAIIERELALERLLEGRDSIMSVDPDLLEEFRQWSSVVEMRKDQLGVAEPSFTYPTDKK